MHPADALTERLGLPIRDRDLLAQALVHSSWLHEHPDAARGHNERLEFLGDAVVSLAVSEALYRRHPDRRRGRPVRAPRGDREHPGPGPARRARSTSARSCCSARARPSAAVASARRCSRPRSRRWSARSTSTSAGTRPATGSTLCAAEELAADIALTTLKSPKSRLQEHTQRTTGDRPDLPPASRRSGRTTRSSSGSRSWSSGRVLGTGEGPSRRIAETSAAAEALEVLRQERSAARTARADRGRRGARGGAGDRDARRRGARHRGRRGGRRGRARRSHGRRRVSAPARLLGLRVQGFKSFAERTLVEFGPGHQRRRRPQRLGQVATSPTPCAGRSASRAARSGSARARTSSGRAPRSAARRAWRT